jgi:glucuronoarabinoxylan endo-1,4-beta-xylanase
MHQYVLICFPAYLTSGGHPTNGAMHMGTITWGFRRYAPRICEAVVVVALSVTGAVLTLTTDSTYQTIEGFGTSAFDPNDDDSAFIDMMINDLGMTALRLYIDEDFEQTNDNSDPFSINLAGCNLNGSDLRGHMRNLRYLKNAGLDKLMLTVFSPPAFMKTNNSLIGGELRVDHYDEFAEYYAAFIKHVKNETSMDVYAISPENEPAWEQWYWSCVYSPQQMRDITKVLGPRLEQEGISTRIVAAEDLITNNWGAYFGTTNVDPVAAPYLYGIAVHAYENGITPSSGSAANWNRLALANRTTGKSVWQTETSGYSINDNWLDQSGEFGTGAFTYACAIYSGLRYGNVSLWLWLAPNNPPWGALQEGMCHHKNKTKKYYASKQYYRYIRPGAVRIKAECDDAGVYPLAFEHAGQQTLTLILINNTNDTKSVSLAGSGWPSFAVYRSSETENCQNMGTSSGAISLPAMSVSTLHGQGYTVPVRKRTAQHARIINTNSKVFDLAGRLLGAVRTTGESGLQSSAPAVRVLQRTSPNGSAARTILGLSR